MMTLTTITTITIDPRSYITTAPAVRPASGYFGTGCFWAVEEIPTDFSADEMLEAYIITRNNAALLWGESPDMSGIELADTTDMLVEYETARRMMTDARL